MQHIMCIGRHRKIMQQQFLCLMMIAASALCTKLQPLSRLDYEIVIERFEVVQEQRENVIFSNLRVSKYNRTATVLQGTFQFVTPITNREMVDITCYWRHGTVYKRGLFDLKNLSYCDYLARDDMRTFREAANLTAKCPVPAGVYELRNYAVEEGRLPLYATEDSWRVDTRLHSGGVTWLHTRLYYRARNKHAVAWLASQHRASSH